MIGLRSWFRRIEEYNSSAGNSQEDARYMAKCATKFS
jgi:hypothetical protein